MIICDFDMNFKYVVVGWEGTTHDSRVLMETIRNPQHNFPMPPSGEYSCFILFIVILFNNMIIYKILFFRKILFSGCNIYTH